MKHEVLKELQTDATRLAKHRTLQNGHESEPSYEQYIIALQSDAELREALRRAMEQLTDREKELLRLRFFENKDYDEIAAACNITKRTAYNIIFAALKTLKAEMLVKEKSKLSIVRAVSVLFMCFLQ
jgi:RNA polymerase sigma-70 factor (ECF subfamily)